jgi:hypothetical protein
MFFRCVVSFSFLSCSSYHCMLHSSLYVFGHFFVMGWNSYSFILHWWTVMTALSGFMYKSMKGKVCMSVTEEKWGKYLHHVTSPRSVNRKNGANCSLMYHLDHSVYQGRL